MKEKHQAPLPKRDIHASMRWRGLNSFGAAGPAVSLITGEVIMPSSAPVGRKSRHRHKIPRSSKSAARWPAYVTSGPLTAEGLQVFVLHSPEHAVQQGFPWVGR